MSWTESQDGIWVSKCGQFKVEKTDEDEYYSYKYTGITFLPLTGRHFSSLNTAKLCCVIG